MYRIVFIANRLPVEEKSTPPVHPLQRILAAQCTLMAATNLGSLLNSCRIKLSPTHPPPSPGQDLRRLWRSLLASRKDPTTQPWSWPNPSNLLLRREPTWPNRCSMVPLVKSGKNVSYSPLPIYFVPPSPCMPATWWVVTTAVDCRLGSRDRNWRKSRLKMSLKFVMLDPIFIVHQ